MELTDRQKQDRELCSSIWYMFRDYGDIQIGQDERWEALVAIADDTARKFPEFRTVITGMILGVLEDRAKKQAERV